MDSPDDTRQLDWWRVAGLVCMAMLIVAFPLYNRGEPMRRKAAQAAMERENIDIGRAMFAQHCAACHGSEARGGRGAPTLAAREFLGSVTDKQLHWLISGGVPGTIMSAYDLDLGGPFTAQQITRLAAYVRSLEPDAPSVQGWFKGAPAPPRAMARTRRGGDDHPERHDESRDDRLTGSAGGGSDTRRSAAGTAPGEVARGNAAAVYAARCSACHGAAGEGSTIAPALRPMRAAIAAQPEQAFDRIARGVPGTSMAAFSAQHGGPLDETMIRALVAWLREGSAPR
jgi:mono/diheme cytochrome c family protein